ncbi:hypothetical protein [Candidatus Poriferisocius sp.]|uniref:hypothetical protein n=1 Tax=Candidatus Poriferisocius sp. TaxID=3101276 RepID=UPI003B016309
MGSYWLALVGVAVTQAVNIGIMWAKGRRQEKGDRISDLQAAQDTRFDDMNRRFDESRDDMNRRFDESRDDMNRRFDEARADSDKKFAEMRADSDKKHDALVALITAQGQEIKELEIKFTEKLNAGLGDLRTEMHKGFRDHGERLARIETRLEFSHPIPDPDHTPADSEATVLPGPGRS